MGTRGRWRNIASSCAARSRDTTAPRSIRRATPSSSCSGRRSRRSRRHPKDEPPRREAGFGFGSASTRELRSSRPRATSAPMSIARAVSRTPDSGGQILVSATTATLVEADGFELLDLGKHRLKDLARPERLFQLGSGAFPPIRSLSPSNLPAPTTAFLGRRAELERLKQILATGNARVVTLTGPGGIGKTRLAVQAARESSERFPDGRWWVPLGPLSDPQLVQSGYGRGVGPGRASRGGRFLRSVRASRLRKRDGPPRQRRAPPALAGGGARAGHRCCRGSDVPRHEPGASPPGVGVRVPDPGDERRRRHILLPLQSEGGRYRTGTVRSSIAPVRAARSPAVGDAARGRATEGVHGRAAHGPAVEPPRRQGPARRGPTTSHPSRRDRMESLAPLARAAAGVPTHLDLPCGCHRRGPGRDHGNGLRHPLRALGCQPAPPPRRRERASLLDARRRSASSLASDWRWRTRFRWCAPVTPASIGPWPPERVVCSTAGPMDWLGVLDGRSRTCEPRCRGSSNSRTSKPRRTSPARSGGTGSSERYWRSCDRGWIGRSRAVRDTVPPSPVRSTGCRRPPTSRANMSSRAPQRRRRSPPRASSVTRCASSTH